MGLQLPSLIFANRVRCNCNDTCGAVSLPLTPFRKGQNLQAFLVSDRVHSLGSQRIMGGLYGINSMFLCFITIQGIFGLLEIKFTQAQFRNKILILLGGESSYGGRRGLFSKVRFHTAKLIALSFFICAVIAAIVSPAVFTSSVIVNEIMTWEYPVSEDYDAVGQVICPRRQLDTAILTVLSGAHGLAPPSYLSQP